MSICVAGYHLLYVNVWLCIIYCMVILWVVYSPEGACPQRLAVEWGDSELPLLLPGLQRERAGPCDLSTLWKTLLPAVGPGSLSTSTTTTTTTTTTITITITTNTTTIILLLLLLLLLLL